MDSVHVCTANDVDETAPLPADKKPKQKRSVRVEVLALGDIAIQAKHLAWHHPWFSEKNKLHTLSGFKALFDYAVFYGPQRGGKKKIPVDIPKMIAGWTDWIATFSTAHSKDEVDRVEFQIDELLTPMLTAPVKQIRQFYQGLVDSLEADKRIPFYVWATFSAWGKVVIEPAEDKEAIVRLKKKLASEIADLVEQDERVRIDYRKAMIGALQWRSPEVLKDIKEDLEAGAKPKIKGRQSCLFLTTKRRGRGAREHSVML